MLGLRFRKFCEVLELSLLFSNMANLLQIKLWEVLQKTGRKNVSDKAPVKLQG